MPELEDILQQLADGEEKTLLTAMDKAQRLLMESPTEQNSRALLRAVKKDLQDLLARKVRRNLWRSGSIRTWI